MQGGKGLKLDLVLYAFGRPRLSGQPMEVQLVINQIHLI